MSSKENELPADATREEQIAFYKEKILRTLEQDGEIDKIRKLINDQANKANWKASVKVMATNAISPDEIESLTAEVLTDRIREQAIKSLPENLKANVMKQIKETITKKQVIAENSNK